MPSPDLFQIGVSGLVGSQLGLSTTSHNISNVNTTGYSRQRADFDARAPQFLGGQFFGTGTELRGVNRLYSQTITYELRANNTSYQQFKTFAEEASRLDNIVASATTGLNTSLQSYFSAVQGVSEDPTSIPARRVLLSQASQLSTRFNSLYTTFSDHLDQVNESLAASMNDINALTAGIAKLNESIITAKATGPGEPNDLLDERDRLLDQINEFVSTSTLDQPDGSVSVFAGSGQVMVIGVYASTFSVAASSADPEVSAIYATSAATAAPVEITGQMVGGRIGGLLQFREELLLPAMNKLGKVAIAIAETTNAQHALGMDLNDQLGGLFFTDFNGGTIPTDRVAAHSSNIGNAGISVTVDDVNRLTDSDYDLTLTAGMYTLTRLSDNAVISNFADPGSPATVTLATEGITINFNSGAAIDGDSFKLLPTRNASANMKTVVDDVTEIAAAFPVRGTVSVNNTGNAYIKSMQMLDTTTAAFTTTPGALEPPLRIVFTSATTYDVIDANTLGVLGSGLFTPNADNAMLAQAGLDVVMGYDITLTGVPQTNDQFNVTYNTGGYGDNRNSSLLSGLQTAGTLDGGRSTFGQSYGELISDVGARTSEAKVSEASSLTLMRQSETRRESVSGVNLDEEAANLLRFQQAYQASAQIISVANQMFDVLFQSVR